MGQAYPELVRAEPLITETLKLEETRFRKTLERGLAILDEETASLKRGDNLKGEVAFTLYDTFGFPLDLTQDALQAARHRRRHSTPSTPRWSASAKRRGRRGRARAKPRPRPCGSRCARRPAPPSSSATRPRPRKASSPRWCATARRSPRSAKGETGAVVLNQTPFYGESGGQVGDTGVMTADGVRFRVTDTQKKARRPLRPFRRGRGGHAQARPRARARSRPRAAAAPSAPTIRRPICCTRRCARCSATTSPRRARWSRRSGCGSTSRIPSR